MGGLLDERFGVVPQIVAAGGTQVSQAGADTSAVTESKVNVPSKPPAGLTYRFKLAGTKTGANAAHTVTLVLGSTTLQTLTADAATAKDWVAEFTVRFNSANVQKVMGLLSGDELDAICEYDAGAVDCSAGAALQCKVTSGHASDTVTAEMVTVERWVL